MSARATLVGKLPDPDLNGLANAAQTILDNADDETKRYTVIARLFLEKGETNYRNGDVTAKLVIEAIEVIAGSDETVIKATMAAALEQRTGIKQLDGFKTNFEKSFGTGFDGDSETGEIG